VPAVLEAVRSYATVGEISSTLAEVFGRHRASTVT
jgi:methylmalonyl-CoA mutase N-terminal domain/subunit